MGLDTMDLSILSLLKQNAKNTASQISKKVGLSIPAVMERIRKLDEAKVINRYTVQLDHKKLGYNILAFIFVNIEKTENIQRFRDVVTQFSQVLECHHMAGEYDYLLKVVTTDTAELEDFLSNGLKSIAGVEKSNTLIALSTLKEELNR